MKKWNAPEVAELNINETANGVWPAEAEVWPFIHDHEHKYPEGGNGDGSGEGSGDGETNLHS